MDRGLIFLLCLIVALALVVPLGSGERDAVAEAYAAPAVKWIMTGEAVSTDGTLSLASVSWSVEGIASGGDYWLENINTPMLTGSGCCCLYLPCLYRNH